MKPILTYYREAWGVITRHPGLIGVTTLYIVLSIVLSFVSEMPEHAGIRAALMGLSYLIQFVLMLGMLKAALRAADGVSPRAVELFMGYPFFLPALGAYVLAGLAFLAGLVALILPGIYIAIRLQFVFYAVVEGCTALEALQKSWEVTRGRVLWLLGFGLVGVLLNFLGMLALLVGLVVTFPWTLAAQALLYRDLARQE